MDNETEWCSDEIKVEPDILARYPRIAMENNNYIGDEQNGANHRELCGEDLSKKLKEEEADDDPINRHGNENPLDMRKQRRKQSTPRQHPEELAQDDDQSPTTSLSMDEQRLEQLLNNYKADMIGFVERAFDELRRNLRAQLAREMASAQLTDLARRNLVANLAHVANLSKAATLPTSLWNPFGVASQSNAWHRAYPHSMYHYPHIPLSQINHSEVKTSADEQLSMIFNPPKRKRTKVTDTRLASRMPRSVTQELDDTFEGDDEITGELGIKASTSSPTTGHTPSPNSSPAASDFSMSIDGLQTTQLTPMHLRKAKLMFFYVRYPSSALLKSFFPDVLFNKNNTAQLVKWFSNFREFFYIQMEKYARQYLANGITDPLLLKVTRSDDLLRTLNIHYNRNNQLPVPDSFVAVSEKTLQEFFRAVQQAKDSEPSWKKAIYKVIQRSDDIVPEFFKSTAWMEQLAD